MEDTSKDNIKKPEHGTPESYLTLLDRALSIAPKTREKGERFTLPEVSSSIVGSRTIIDNFREISDRLNRDPKHLLRFFARELATAALISDPRAIFQGRFGHTTLKNLVERYVRDFVICPVCGRPDTTIEKRKRLSFLLCEACGATSSVRTI